MKLEYRWNSLQWSSCVQLQLWGGWVNRFLICFLGRASMCVTAPWTLNSPSKSLFSQTWLPWFSPPNDRALELTERYPMFLNTFQTKNIFSFFPGTNNSFTKKDQPGVSTFITDIWSLKACWGLNPGPCALLEAHYHLDTCSNCMVIGTEKFARREKS